MDIEFCIPQLPQDSIFKGIEEFPIPELYQEAVVLENTFAASPQQTHPSILLTLINNTLLLSNPDSPQVTPHAAVTLDFDLKF